MNESLRLGIGEQGYLEDGSQVRVVLPPLEWENVVLNEVEHHEVDHTIVQHVLRPGTVKEVSTIAEGNTLGHMTPSVMLLPAVLAAEGENRKGTWGDNLIAQRLGGDPGPAKTVAKSIIRRTPNERKSLGFELKKKRRLKEQEVVFAIERVNLPRVADVFVHYPDGTFMTLQQEVDNGFVSLQRNDLPLAA